MKAFWKKNKVGVIVFFALLIVDQLTKIVADARLEEYENGWWLSDILGIQLVYNRGIAYGIGAGSPTWLKFGVIVLTAIVMAALAVAYLLMDEKRKLLRLSFVFISSGGLGNFIDRVMYRVWQEGGARGVRDMVNLSRFGFAVCNFADFFISAGAVMLVLSLLFFDKDAAFPVGKYKEQAQKEEAEKEKGKGEEN